MKLIVFLFALLPLVSYAQPCTGPIADFCEEEPKFPGGQDSMKVYIDEKVKALGLTGAAGNVFVQFIVSSNGTLSEIVVVKSLSSKLDAEALKIVAGMPSWNPGKQQGKPICVRYTIPVSFGPSTAAPEPQLIIMEPDKKRKKGRK